MNYTLLKDENQKLSQDVAILKQTQSIGNIGNLKQQVQATTNRVNQLEYSNTVRNQDILALSKITNQNKLDITTCSTVGKNLTQQITSVEQEFHKKTQNVAFTAWNEGGNVTSDKVIKFNKVKTSTGVSNLAAIHSTGTFTVEVHICGDSQL
ncbi:Hypothetical predicted protein [Mytilus galloprovincialis]|uniref:Uncharacterized protein n=1 Tax=Mytilus galloprovincialis TaxID=29158 RepID=A0A8B6E7M8_MYTGA|nr:Hypothetical predicted protein [Mytilus galloprovincialis]